MMMVLIVILIVIVMRMNILDYGMVLYIQLKKAL